MKPLRIRPISIRDAKAFVREHHRHHPAPTGAKFAICAMLDTRLVGVALVGRPVARRDEEKQDNGIFIAEIIRVAVIPDLPPVGGNDAGACSKLYTYAKRIAQLMGYDKIITKTMPDESGVSLRAARFKNTGTTDGRSWNVPSRARVDKHPLGTKLKWEAA